MRSQDAVQAVYNAFAEIDEPNKAEESVLHWAAYLGFGGLVASLLKGGLNKEEKNYYRETALHVAAQSGP